MRPCAINDVREGEGRERGRVWCLRQYLTYSHGQSSHHQSTPCKPKMVTMVTDLTVPSWAGQATPPRYATPPDDVHVCYSGGGRMVRRGGRVGSME